MELGQAHSVRTRGVPLSLNLYFIAVQTSKLYTSISFKLTKSTIKCILTLTKPTIMQPLSLLDRALTRVPLVSHRKRLQRHSTSRWLKTRAVPRSQVLSAAS